MNRNALLLLASSLSLFACGGGSTTNPSSPQVASAPSNLGSSNTKTFTELCASPGVLFCEDFEQGISNSWIRDGGDVKLVSGQAKNNEGNNVVELRTYENIRSSKLLYTFSNQNEAYVRYDVQYAADYDNSDGSHGPVLGGSQSPPWGMMGVAGKVPNGSDFFVLNHEPVREFSVKSIPGEFGFYAYFVNMSGRWGNFFTSTLNPKAIITPGQWHCVEFGLRLNTAGANNRDGKAFFWVDGIAHGDFDNFQWRTSPNLMINTLMLDSYNHFLGGTRPASRSNRVRYDNVIISTQPVGCL